MVWIFIPLSILIILGFGTAIFMARKTKAPNITVIRHEHQGIDLEEFATKIAKAVAKEVAEEVVKKLPKGQVVYGAGMGDSDGPIMDESIIPIAVETAITEANLEGMTKEEKAVDKDLEKAKSKLAGILKKRKDKDGPEEM